MPILTELEYTGENPVFLQPNEVETVAIIGGGASGAISLDALLKEKPSPFKKIDVFERRPVLGGIWVFDESPDKSAIDSTKSGKVQLDPELPNPFTNQESKKKFIVTPKTNQERFEQTPSYGDIVTNVPERLMTYSDVKIWDLPEGTPDAKREFVSGRVVNNYINEYFKKNLDDPRVSLTLSTTVEDVEKIPKYSENPQSLGYKFRLTLRQKLDNEQDIWWQQDYDSIIVATGHYHIPQIPEVEGLKEIEKIPDVIHHGKFFRGGDQYKDKKVIVVGSRASGSDIINALTTKAKKIYQSKRSNYTRDILKPDSGAEEKPVIKSYKKTDSGFNVIFEDGSIIENPDHIIYATGYSFSYPYLNRFFKNLLVRKGIVANTYQHIFPIGEPLITIVGIPVDGISFRVFEYQAVLVSRYLAGKIQLPSISEQLKWANDLLGVKGYTRAYHTIGFEQALIYASALTNLGEIENEKLDQGRPFPEYTEADIQEFTRLRKLLEEKWGKINN